MTIGQFFFKGMRKAYREVFLRHPAPLARCNDAEESSAAIYNLLASGKPCMVARFGSVELSCVLNYLSVRAHAEGRRSLLRYVRGEGSDWWWNDHILHAMCNNAGFFPSTPAMLERFAQLMLDDMQQVDILGSWLRGEKDVAEYMASDVFKIRLEYLNPYFTQHTWTSSMAGKKVLVVHPFANLIARQYAERRTLLFANPEVLPLFELRTLKAVQSLGGEDNGFADWFEALRWMEEQMDAVPYDVALIGCGAYGLPLAAHAKRTGHQAVHLGGALQLLFGIKGKRWEMPGYVGTDHDYSKLYNEHWVRPGEAEKPQNADQVEEGCYW